MSRKKRQEAEKKVRLAPTPANILSQAISYIFHPVFIPLYVFYYFIFLDTTLFAGFSAQSKLRTMAFAGLNLVFFPLLTTLLLKALGFIQSIFLRTQRDRIIPYIAYSIFAFSAYNVLSKAGIYPPITAAFVLGILLASSAGLMCNIYSKVSMHTIGVGGLVGVFVVLVYVAGIKMAWPIATALCIAGLVGTARLQVSDHNTTQVYLGFVIGILSQVVAALVVL